MNRDEVPATYDTVATPTTRLYVEAVKPLTST